MARQSVIEVVCDRCGRVETQETSKVFNPPDSMAKLWSSPGGDPLEVTFRFRDQEVSYEDLCGSCRKTIENKFESIVAVTPESRAREGKKKEEAAKPGSDTPPGFEQKRGPRASSAS